MARAGIAKAKQAAAENNGKVPEREFRISKIQILVEADVVEDGKKIDEVAVGARDENGGIIPYVFYNIDNVLEWANNFTKELEKLGKAHA